MERELVRDFWLFFFGSGSGRGGESTIEKRSRAPRANLPFRFFDFSLSLSLGRSASSSMLSLFSRGVSSSFRHTLSLSRERRTPFPTRCWMSYLAHTERSMSSREEFAGAAPLIFLVSVSTLPRDDLQRFESTLLPPSPLPRATGLLLPAASRKLSRRLSQGGGRARSGRESGGKGGANAFCVTALSLSLRFFPLECFSVFLSASPSFVSFFCSSQTLLSLLHPLSLSLSLPLPLTPRPKRAPPSPRAAAASA